MPRRRFELLRVCTHGPLKTACLPIPPPRRCYAGPGWAPDLPTLWQEWEDSNPRPAVLETAALPAELHSCMRPLWFLPRRLQSPYRRRRRRRPQRRSAFTYVGGTPARTRTGACGLGNRCSVRLSYRGTGGFPPPKAEVWRSHRLGPTVGADGTARICQPRCPACRLIIPKCGPPVKGPYAGCIRCAGFAGIRSVPMNRWPGPPTALFAVPSG